MANNKLAIIGGSGLYDVEEFKNRELIDLDTPWGKPVSYTHLTLPTICSV